MSNLGCVRNVTDDAGFLGDMHPGQVLVLKQDVFIWDDNAARPWFDPASNSPGLRLEIPGGGSTMDGDGIGDLPSLDEYARGDRPVNIRGIMRKGSVFSLDQIDWVDGVDVEPIWYQFKMIEGDYRGQVFCLTDLMLEEPHSPCRRPNPEFLQAVP